MNAEKLKKIMNSSDKTWFTIQNLSELTQEPSSEIQKVIRHSDGFVRSSAPDNSGDPLFATKLNYKKKGSLFNKVIGAFKNRID